MTDMADDRKSDDLEGDAPEDESGSALKMELTDAVQFRNGDWFSETWFEQAFYPVFRSRRCSGCGKTTSAPFAVFPGTTTRMRFFGYTADAIRRIVSALGLETFCFDCWDVKVGWRDPRRWRKPEGKEKSDG